MISWYKHINFFSAFYAIQNCIFLLLLVLSILKFLSSNKHAFIPLWNRPWDGQLSQWYHITVKCQKRKVVHTAPLKINKSNPTAPHPSVHEVPWSDSAQECLWQRGNKAFQTEMVGNKQCGCNVMKPVQKKIVMSVIGRLRGVQKRKKTKTNIYIHIYTELTQTFN